MSEIKIKPIDSKKDCLNIALHLLNPKTEEAKLKIELALKYFKENTSSFTNDEINILKNNKNFNITQHESSDLLKNLNVIPVSSIETCVHISQTILNPLTKDDKYQLYLAQTYFKENILNFSADEFNTISKNKYFLKNLGNKYAGDILDKCIEFDRVFSVPLAGWFERSIFSNKKQDYLIILNRENNKEQIDFFYKNDPSLVESLFFNSLYQSDSLVHTVLKHNPKYILDVFSWDEDKIVEWIKDNKTHTKQILEWGCVGNKLKNKKIKNQLYKNVVDEIKYCNDIGLTSHYFLISPVDFLSYIKKNEYDLFNSFIHSFIYDKRTSNDIVVNGAQFLLIKKRNASINQMKEVFNDNLNLLLEDIEEHISFFIKSIHPFEYGLRNDSFKFFSLFSDNLNLNENELNMNVAAAFAYLRKAINSTSKDSDKYLDSWCQETLVSSDYDLFSSYIKKFEDVLYTDSDDKFLKEVRAIKLMKELTNNLSSKDVKTKQNKI